MRLIKFSNYCVLYLLISLLTWGLTGFSQTVFGGPEERCLDCHDKTWQDGLAKMFVHQPFQDKKCQGCHVDPPAKNGREQKSLKQKGVKWISRNFNQASTHWFKFSPTEGYETIFMVATGNRGKTLENESPLPPLANLPRFDNDHAQPRIYNVKVVEVKKGIFLSAVISWETDEMANSKVSYGLKNLNSSSLLDNSFTTNHQVTLFGIKSKKTYQFKVVSEDLFGNSSTSDVFNLATHKSFSLLNEQLSNPKSDLKKFELNTELFQSDGQYLVKVTTNQPVKLALGTIQASSQKSVYSQDENSPQDIKHVLVNNDLHLNLSACYSCHRKYQEGMSHPVNVYPKNGIVIPPEYPTLPDGRMTCMSCHTKHASNVRDRLIKSSSKALCAGCHIGMR